MGRMWLANIGSSVISMACLVGFLFIWHPKRVFTFEGEEAKTEHRAAHGFSRADVTRAWVPWIILSIIVFVWGSQTGKKFMNTPEKVITSTATWQTPPSKITNPQFVVGGLNNLALRIPPVVTKPTKEPARQVDGTAQAFSVDPRAFVATFPEQTSVNFSSRPQCT